jgi:hypothetical protein
MQNVIRNALGQTVGGSTAKTYIRPTVAILARFDNFDISARAGLFGGVPRS